MILNSFNKPKIKKTAEILINQVEKLLSERNDWIEDISRGNREKSIEHANKSCKLLKLCNELLKITTGYLSPQIAATKIQALVRMFLQRKSYKRAQRRKNIIFELCQTEKTYICNLSVIISVFLNPLQELEKKGKELISVENRKIIFGNVDESLFVSHKGFAEKLQERTVRWTIFSSIGDICDSFFKRKKILEIYSNYINRYDEATKIITSLITNKSWSKFVSTQEKDPRCSNLDLMSYLVCPVQRVPRYVLLFKDLLKSTEKNHPDYKNIQTSFDSVASLASDINNAKNSNNELKKLQTLFDNEFEESPSFVIEKRNLVSRDIVTVEYDPKLKENNQRTIFVFNDILLGAAPKKKKFVQQWISSIENCHVEISSIQHRSSLRNVTSENKLFELVEFQLTNEFPFSRRICKYFFQHEKYDFNFWHTLLSSLQNSSGSGPNTVLEKFSSHFENKLVSANDWELLKSIAKCKTTCNKNDLIFQSSLLEDSNNLYFIDVGAVGVKRSFVNKPTLVSILKSDTYDNFFGMEEFLGIKSGNTYSAIQENTLIYTIDGTKLKNLFFSNHSLSYHFYMLLSVKLARKIHTNSVENILLNREERFKLNDVYESLLKSSAKKVLYDSRENQQAKGIFELFEIKYEAGDNIINTFDCVLRKGSLTKLRGELFIIRDNLCFLSKRNKLKIPIKTVTTWYVDNKKESYNIYFLAEKEKHCFKFFQRPLHLEMFIDKFVKRSNSPVVRNLKRDRSMTLNISGGSEVLTTNNLHFNQSEWMEMMECGTLMSFKAGETVLEKNYKQQTIFIIMKGLCEIQSEFENSAKVLHTLRPGEYFGEKSFLFGSPSPNKFVIAAEDSELYCYERSSLETLFNKNNEIGAKFFGNLAYCLSVRSHTKVSNIEKKLEELVLNNSNPTLKKEIEKEIEFLLKN